MNTTYIKMKDYKAEATEKTPEIIGDFDSGTLSIKGMCYPDDCIQYFHPLLNWIKMFQLTEAKNMEVTIDLEHLNTTSALILYRILKNLGRCCESKTVTINWLVQEDDIDMIELAEDYQEMLGNYIQVQQKFKKAS